MPKVPSRKLLAIFSLVLALSLLLPALPAAAQGVTPTNEWVNFYGLDTKLNGAAVPAGAVITAYAASGALCGQFVVHTAGQYGVMPCYRDDPLTAAKEGAAPGEAISFQINGVAASPTGPGTAVWTANGDVIQVNLSAGGGAAPTNTAVVVPPTNTSVPPAATNTTVPPVATATSTPQGQPQPTATTGTPGSAPEWVNFYGVVSEYEGLPIPVGALVEAWSSTGVKCGQFAVTTAGSYGVLACQRAAQGQPGVQPGDTVYFTINGKAARAIGPDQPTWTSQGDRRHVELEVPPLTPVAPTATATSVAPPPGTAPAPEWVNFYGVQSTLDGQALPVGAKVEAFAPDNTKCGEFTVTVPGQYGVLPCYRAATGVAGAHPGDLISFKINSRPATANGPDSAEWTRQGDLRHVELAVAPLTPQPTPQATGTGTPSGPPSSPEWVNFYGISSTLEGQPLPVGSVVVAWSPDGVQCGSFTVSAAGSYGLLACLGAPIGLPGAHPNDPIYFTINGRAAMAKGPDSAVWTSNGALRHVELDIPVGGTTPVPTVSGPTPTGTPGAGPTNTPTATTVPGGPTPTPTRTDQRCQGVNYTVKWGDWLYKIAARFKVSAADILYCNPLPNPNLLRPGQILLIPGASATPAPTPSASPTPPAGTVYIVRCGDTLSSIAWRFGTTIRAIMNANGLVNANYIYIGQRLVIPGNGGTTQPPTGTYVVKYGDSLYKISLQYGISWWKLAVYNNLYWPYIIYPGQVLQIP